MSTAHVVAEADDLSVVVDGNTYSAQAVSYDPHADISILDVPNLAAQPLTFVESPAPTGTDALILVIPAVVRLLPLRHASARSSDSTARTSTARRR